jgi:hypothetical protein
MYCANIEVVDSAVRKHSKTKEAVLPEDIEVEEKSPPLPKPGCFPFENRFLISDRKSEEV